MKPVAAELETIRARYRRNVRFYDRLDLRPFQRLRARAVELLQLRAGQTVLDLGCGTGLGFALLERAVGPGGHVLGLDVSPDMLARAAQRARLNGWSNVLVVEADARHTPIRARSVDALLAFYTHDIMTSRDAVFGGLEALRPGGQFVAAGGKRAHGPGALLLNAFTLVYSWPFADVTENPVRPWLHLERALGRLAVEERLWGTAYLAHGVKES